MTKKPDPKALCDHVDSLNILSVGHAASVIEGYSPEPGHEPPPEAYLRQTELKHWLLERHQITSPGWTLPKKALGLPKELYRQFCEERGIYPEALFPERRKGNVRKKRDVEQEAKDANRIQRVINAAEAVAKPGSRKSNSSIAREIAGTQGFKSESIRKILDGRYKRMREIGITSPYAAGTGNSSPKK